MSLSATCTYLRVPVRRPSSWRFSESENVHMYDRSGRIGQKDYLARGDDGRVCER